VLVRYLEASGKTATAAKVALATAVLGSLALEDADLMTRASRVAFDFGDPENAYRVHEQLFARFGASLVGPARAEALYRLGESARRLGDVDGALRSLREASDIDPSYALPLLALAELYDRKEDWPNAVAARRARLGLVPAAERFDLLLEIGDLLSTKLSDRALAAKVYSEALDERPSDRKLLTKLMQLYSDEKDWEKVSAVVLRLADFVEDPRQRAKYMHTAATIASKQLNDVPKSLEFYRRALEYDPTIEKARGEAIELYEARGEHDEVEHLLKGELEQAKTAQDKQRIVQALDKLGDLYEKGLNDADLAVDAFEAAQAFGPDEPVRAEKLAGLYTADPAQYLDKAIAAHAALLRKNPYRIESYKELRALYTGAKRADAAWCLSQALSLLRVAEPEEERFYLQHRASNAAPARATLDDDAWAKLVHWDLDPLLTRIFVLIEPTIVRSRTQPLEALGLDPRYAIDCSLHPYPVSQTLYYVQGVLAMPPPLVFQNTNDPGTLGIVHARTPAILLGRGAFDSAITNPAMAFMAGRHLTSFRPGFYVRHLVPTGTGLKAWLFAAIKHCVPQFPVASELGGQVADAMNELTAHFGAAEKEMLASAVSKLLQAGGALDLKKWVAAIDLTGDRVGLLLAHDLQITTEVIRNAGDSAAASVPVKERMKDIVLFSVSEEYFALRQKLSIALGP
jgi:tetratricopeptide (TPR) repeat protein